MIDPKRLRENPDEVLKALHDRKFPTEDLDTLITKDKEWRTLLTQVDSLKQQRNENTPKGKPTPEALARLQSLSAEVKAAQETLQTLEDEVKALSLQLPNIPAEDCPVGADETDNKEVRTEGSIPSFDFEPLSHQELSEKHNLYDSEKTAAISGARFVTYMGQGAKLERALINFMLDTHTNKHGYTEVMPPVIVNSKSMQGTGQLPKFHEDSFKIEDSDFWLSPTGEVQLTNLAQNQLFQESDLPIKWVGYTPCFRKESGSYGKDTSGLIRLHQFNKVELVQLVTPETAQAAHEKLTQEAEAILKALNLPYRVINLCTGDLGFTAAKTYDLEVWLPKQNKYREISSCSIFNDFQSRRSMIRYKQGTGGQNQYVYTLNGSGLAVGRTFAAILENYQDANGNVNIPDVLQPYFGGSCIS